MWFILRRIIGVILVIIGIAALVTPLTPGAWLGLIGLEMLGLGFLIPQRVRDAGDRFLLNIKKKIMRSSTDRHA